MILGLYSASLCSGSKEIPLFDRRCPGIVPTSAANDSVREEDNGVAHKYDPGQETERLNSLHFMACGVNNLVDIAARSGKSD